MALWHFTVGLIPRNAIAPIHTSGGLDMSPSWRGTERDWNRIVTGLLLESKDRWSSDVESWGDDAGVQLTVIRDEGHTIECLLRINVQHNAHILLAKLVDRFNDADLSIVYSLNDIRIPSYPDLITEMKQSRAFALYCGTDAEKKRAWEKFIAVKKRDLPN